MEKKITTSDIKKVKQWGSVASIGDDLMVLNRLDNTPLLQHPRLMNFMLIALCTRGEARYTLDMNEIVIRPGDAIIISERHVVDGFTASPDLQGMCMVISVKFFYEIIKNVSDLSVLFLYSHNNPVMSFSEKEQQVFKNYLNMIAMKIDDDTNHFRTDLARTLILAMFYDLGNVFYRNQHTTERRHSRTDTIFTQFIRLVEKHCKHERRVSWYAQQLCITPKYLSEAVKQASRRTPNEWIDNYVTLQLRVLLKNTTKSIKEIADELNFPNQSFLGKYFKEHVGMSPSKYRHS